jgi:hypothetical protein
VLVESANSSSSNNPNSDVSSSADARYWRSGELVADELVEDVSRKPNLLSVLRCSGLNNDQDDVDDDDGDDDDDDDDNEVERGFVLGGTVVSGTLSVIDLIKSSGEINAPLKQVLPPPLCVTKCVQDVLVNDNTVPPCCRITFDSAVLSRSPTSRPNANVQPCNNIIAPSDTQMPAAVHEGSTAEVRRGDGGWRARMKQDGCCAGR